MTRETQELRSSLQFSQKDIERFHLESIQMVVEHAHRTGNPSLYSGKTPRPILIKFLRYKDKMAVLGKAKDLKGTNIYVNEDVTEAVRQKHKEPFPAMKAARERGSIAYIRYDRSTPLPKSQELELETSSLVFIT